jgi:hypothetical protein
MYSNFDQFLEEKHPEYFDEGIGSWVGNTPQPVPPPVVSQP